METKTQTIITENKSNAKVNWQTTFKRDPASIGRALKRPSSPMMNRSKFVPPKQIEHVALLFKKDTIQNIAMESFPLLSPKKVIPSVSNSA